VVATTHHGTQSTLNLSARPWKSNEAACLSHTGVAREETLDRKRQGSMVTVPLPEFLRRTSTISNRVALARNLV
jgi:hypothetical protein